MDEDQALSNVVKKDEVAGTELPQSATGREIDGGRRKTGERRWESSRRSKSLGDS
jgi:hypothetical protein